MTKKNKRLIQEFDYVKLKGVENPPEGFEGDLTLYVVGSRQQQVVDGYTTTLTTQFIVAKIDDNAQVADEVMGVVLGDDLKWVGGKKQAALDKTSSTFTEAQEKPTSKDKGQLEGIPLQ